MSQSLHNIQIQILKKLLFSPKLRYTQLRPSEDIENNKLNFHLNQLQTLEFLVKENGYYLLTNKGKEFASRLDVDELKIVKQAKISAWVCSILTMGEEKQYLISTRLKSPFYGCQGFISGKVNYGENITDAAKRELQEETGLNGDPIVVALKHYKVFDNKTKELLEDKFMFLSIVENPTGQIIQTQESESKWVKKSDLKTYIKNHYESWESFEQLIKLIDDFDGKIQFIEEDYYGGNF